MNNLNKIQGFIDNLENKKGRFLFLVIDSKGQPMASIGNIYKQVKELIELGYNASILTDSEKYGGVEWLGEEFKNIPVINIKQEDLNVNGSDFIFIPELYTSIMSAIKDFPCKKVVMVQNYDYALETIDVGSKWSDYNFFDAIVTNENMENFVSNHFQTIKTHIVPLSIPSYFKPNDTLRKPIVLIGSRDYNEASRFVKSFYLQNPFYQWISFKIVTDINREDLVGELNESALLVWIDKTASFGTLPLEAMATNTPVLGVIPNMIPEWMINENGELNNNGIWVSNTFELLNILPDYLKVWLEDEHENVVSIDEMKNTVERYSNEKQIESIKTVYNGLIENRITEFKKIIEKYGKDSE